MHDAYMDPMAIKVDEQYGLHHEDDYVRGHLVDGDEQSPNDSPNEYNHFDFHQSSNAQLDHIFSSAPYQTTFSAPQPLHPLNTNILWPSQITNPSERNPPVSMPLQHRPIAPVTETTPAPAPAPTPPKSTPTLPTSRKTLTDDDRRRMCKYHDENPTVKQTEIGALFGVERSTVSKVLRQKEKYLVAEDGRRSPVKRSKSKFPDIERTLSNWAKNRLSEKLPINDALIRDEARKFASTLGSTECANQVNDPVWLEKFKQKNHLPGAKSDIKVERDDTSPKSGSHTPNGVSPTVGWDGMPINQVKDEFKTKSPDSIFDASNQWSHTHNQSTTSLGSCFSDTNFSGDFRSPTSPYFSPMSSCGPSPGMPAQKAPRLPTLAPAAIRRRQTVPLMGPESPEQGSSKPVLECPTDEMEISPITMDNTLHQPRPSQTRFPSQHAASSNNISPVSPPPPTTDEARAALEILRKFIEHQPTGAIDPHDYVVIGKWIQMLKLDGGGLPGGMHSIGSGVERGDGTIPIGRKRSAHSLS